jgi:hypothetical protein
MFTKRIIQNCFRQAQIYQFAKQKNTGSNTSNTVSAKQGQISQVIGAVVDVQFDG